MNAPVIRFKEFNDEWNCRKLNSFVERITQKNKNNSDLVLTISAQNGLVDQRSFFNKNVSSKDIEGYYLLNNGDFAYNKSYSSGYPWGAIKKLNMYKSGVVSPLYICFRINDKNIDSDYLEEYFETTKWHKQIQEISVEGARNHGLLNMSVNDFFNTEHFIPNLEEQIKLGKLFQSFDKVITAQENKISLLQKSKEGIKNRFMEKDYKNTTLGEILTKWNEKNKEEKYSYIESVSNKSGFISQREQFDERNVASKNLKNYYVIRKNVFAYNPSRLNVGSLALKKDDNVSVVSPLYECFTTNQNQDYMLEWFDSKFFRKETYSKFEGGVRNTLSFNNLCSIKINLPSIKEQEEIVKILNQYNILIDLEKKKLEQIKLLKKGLMQNMFV